MSLPHVLKRIRLELARSKEFPMGSTRHGYEFVAPQSTRICGRNTGSIAGCADSGTAPRTRLGD
jgi:hypothetical protein